MPALQETEGLFDIKLKTVEHLIGMGRKINENLIHDRRITHTIKNMYTTLIIIVVHKQMTRRHN